MDEGEVLRIWTFSAKGWSKMRCLKNRRSDSREQPRVDNSKSEVGKWTEDKSYYWGYLLPKKSAKVGRVVDEQTNKKRASEAEVDLRYYERENAKNADNKEYKDD